MAVEDGTNAQADGSAAEPAATVGPTTTALKDRFKSQSIPLEQDFADLIDVADIGRRALGQNPDQDGSPAAGMAVGSDGKLGLKLADPFVVDSTKGLSIGLGWSIEVTNINPNILEVKEGPGIKRIPAGLSLQLPANSGLQLSSDGLAVKHGDGSGLGSTEDKGLYVNLGPGLQTGSGNQVTLKVSDPFNVDASAGLGLVLEAPMVLNDKKQLGLSWNTDFYRDPPTGKLCLRYDSEKSGLTNPDGKGLIVNLGPGLQIGSGQVTLKAAGPFAVDSTKGLSIGLGWSLEVPKEDQTILEVKEGPGIKRVPEGLSLKLAANSGLQLSSDGLALDPNQTFQKGMIIMFSGSSVPGGWALCDGSNGTPNLIDRFVLGGKLADSGTASSTSMSGSGASKSFAIKTAAVTPSVTVSIAVTTLNMDQMPEHQHELNEFYTSGMWGGIGNNVTFDRDALFKWWPENSGEASTSSDLAGWCFGPVNSSISVTTLSTRKMGGSKSHGHGATGSQPAHDHSADVSPPYYILAFIMKL